MEVSSSCLIESHRMSTCRSRSCPCTLKWGRTNSRSESRWKASLIRILMLLMWSWKYQRPNRPHPWRWTRWLVGRSMSRSMVRSCGGSRLSRVNWSVSCNVRCYWALASKTSHGPNRQSVWSSTFPCSQHQASESGSWKFMRSRDISHRSCTRQWPKEGTISIDYDDGRVEWLFAHSIYK